MTREQEQWMKRAPGLIAWTLIVAIAGFATSYLKEISTNVANLNVKMGTVASDIQYTKNDIIHLKEWKESHSLDSWRMSTRLTRLEDFCRIEEKL